MASRTTAWGIEIGAYAIKAIRLERDGDDVSVSDFAVIPHRRVLSTPDIDQDEIIRLALGQFISQKTLEGEHLVMSVPGHAAFARFAKLPPVEPKKVPDIVKFEAVQQIPFPIDEVEWDYQTFTSDDSPEVEVGIFAITRDRVEHRLNLYAELGLTPELLTLSPVSVYNALSYDHPLSRAQGPVILLDIGTHATDVIIADNGRCWIRTFPLGGAHFTEAIASAFKLGYAKAEKLKQEASTSKYAKQIMQAMRPVFSDLLQDLQRSIGYYQSLHRQGPLRTMVGLGSTFKIPGLRKFIGQQLQINVARLDEYKRIGVGGREAASFAENAVNMATAYGLALQGVGLAQIDVNLVPVKILRDQMWHAKTKWFAAAAAIMVVGAGMSLYRPLSDRGSMNPGVPAVVEEVLVRGGDMRQRFEDAKSEAEVGFEAENVRRLLDYRNVWPHLVHDAAEALAAAGPQPELLGDSAMQIRSIPAGQRRLVQLEQLRGAYLPPVEESQSRRIAVTMDVQLSHDDPDEFLNNTVAKWLRDNAERPGVPYRITDVSFNPTRRRTVKVTEAGEERPQETHRTPATPADAPRRGGSVGGHGPASPAPPGDGVGRRRRAPKGQRQAPGAGGMGGGPRPAGHDAPAPSDPMGAGQRHRTSGQQGPDPEQRKLDELAPVPPPPKLYEGGSEYYLVPITFEVEILEPAAASGPAKQAGRAGGQETSS